MKRLKQLAERMPLGPWLLRQYRNTRFPGSREYWESRYAAGGNSGAGSYGRLAAFKAEMLNAFVRENQIGSVLEFGCGDGNQLAIAEYPCYIGLDVSKTALRLCVERFQDDPAKSFFLYDPDVYIDNASLLQADLTMSIDVIYHLIEDAVYERYMTHLFDASRRFVVIYASNTNDNKPGGHVRHRRFTDWVSEHAADWTLAQKVDNKYPFDPAQPSETSFADFYVFAKTEARVA